jgi:hypothetical protein
LFFFNRKTVGGLKLNDLPGVEALQVPGHISDTLHQFIFSIHDAPTIYSEFFWLDASS